MGTGLTVRQQEPTDLFAAVRHSTAAVRSGDDTYSGQRLLATAARTARHLTDLARERPGIGRSVLPIIMNSSFDALALVFAGFLARIPVAPLGPRLPSDDLAKLVRSLGAQWFIAGPDVKSADDVASLTSTQRLKPSDVITYSGASIESLPNPDSTFVTFHTSGTTGEPKRVDASLTALQFRVAVYRQLLDLRPGDVYWTASPLHHVAGLGMQLMALGCGATALVQPGFSVDGWHQVGIGHATHCLLVPTMIDQLIDAGKLSLVVPRVLQYGAAPIHPDTLRAALRALPATEFVQMYGQTEGNPLASLSAEDHRRAVTEPHILAKVGRPAPGTVLRVADPDPDGIGELCAKAAHLFRVDPDGWLRTGDLATIDSSGYVEIVGRLGERIVRGGENVQAREVEMVLRTHPGIRDAAVVGVPDRRWGELVKAVIVLSKGASITDDELREHARTRLAGYKVPTIWERRPQLPRNAAGKIMRRALLEASEPPAPTSEGRTSHAS